MALLLTGILALTAGCDSSIEAGASGSEAKGGMPDGSGPKTEMEAVESQPDEEIVETASQDQWRGKECGFFLLGLEIDDEEGTGTAYLHLENRKKEGSIRFELLSVYIDDRKGEVSTDNVTVELSAGERHDIMVCFSDPGTAGKLTECGAIHFEVRTSGTRSSSDESVRTFFLKSDPDSIIRNTPAELMVEETEVYNAWRK